MTDNVTERLHFEIASISAKLLDAHKEIKQLKDELDLAHKMHKLAIKERNYERSLVKVLQGELNRRS